MDSRKLDAASTVWTLSSLIFHSQYLKPLVNSKSKDVRLELAHWKHLLCIRCTKSKTQLNISTIPSWYSVTRVSLLSTILIPMYNITFSHISHYSRLPVIRTALVRTSRLFEPFFIPRGYFLTSSTKFLSPVEVRITGSLL